MAVAAACSTVVQRADWAQNAHYALVRSLADGTPQIDAYRETTGDVSYTDGHFYSAKAPGLAFISLPPYLALRAFDKVPPSDDTAIWFLNLFTTIPLLVVLLVLVRRAAEAFEQDTGVLAATALGTGTLVLPFATLYFSHVAAATLGFAAFYVLLRARAGPARLGVMAGAGFLAGLACVFEYPSALVAIALAAYALGRDRPVRRLLAYGLGGLAGLAPLLGYNAWAFGSPTYLSYHDVVSVGGTSGHDVVGAHDAGVYGITAPSLRVLSELLLENRGLLTLTPLAAAGMAGAVLLYQRGRKAEGALCIGLPIVFLLWNSGLTTTFGGPFGGGTPGPRYLIGVLPFLIAPIGLTYRRAPGTTIALGLASMATMVVATVTDPMIGPDFVVRWPRDVLAGRFQDTVIWIAGGPGGYVSMVPFLLLMGIALLATALTLPRMQLGRWDALEAASAVALWFVVAYLVRSIIVPDPTRHGAAVALILTGVAASAQILVVRKMRTVRHRSWPTAEAKPVE